MIVAAYVPCMCAVGWCIEQRPDTTTRDRVFDTLWIALLEVLVACATLVYCFFIMPLFFTLKSAWLQLLWLCVLHPLYFEVMRACMHWAKLSHAAALLCVFPSPNEPTLQVTTGYVVRKVLARNRDLGRTDVVSA